MTIDQLIEKNIEVASLVHRADRLADKFVDSHPKAWDPAQEALRLVSVAEDFTSAYFKIPAKPYIEGARLALERAEMLANKVIAMIQS